MCVNAFCFATGTGMSEAELKRNPVLTDYSVKDLNQDPTLPYDDNSFDVITNVVSVDYLNKPLVRAAHDAFLTKHYWPVLKFLPVQWHCSCLESLLCGPVGS